jgi:Transposase DDE domain
LSQEERNKFTKEAIAHCALENWCVVADREFIGNFWFTNLQTLSYKFVIRLRKKQYKKNLKGKESYASLEKRANKHGRASASVIIEGQEYRLWIVKNETENGDEPLIYLLTNYLNKPDAPALYRLRWKIETCFKHLKTNGFNLEDIRMTDINKIKLMLAILVFIYIAAIVEGESNKENEYVQIKKYKNGSEYKSISYFKLGIGYLMEYTRTLNTFIEFIQKMKQYPKTIFKPCSENVQ